MARKPDFLVDTSLAIALVLADHEDHDLVVEATAGKSLACAGHAAFETYSVLTRLPPPVRLTPIAAERVIAANFPHSRPLGAEAAARLVAELARIGVDGGATYDALVGAAAREHGITLLSRDARAADVYRKLSVAHELV